MSMPETKSRTSKWWWATPVVALVIGVAYLVAGVVGGDVGFGVFGLVLMVVVGLAFVLASRVSETVDGLMSRRDERINRIDTDATLVAGTAVLLTCLVTFMVQIARGQDGAPYSWLCAIGGVAYVVSLVVLRYRR